MQRSLLRLGMPDAIRTHDLQSRSLTLYPAELRAHIRFFKALYYINFFFLICQGFLRNKIIFLQYDNSANLVCLPLFRA